VTAAAARRRALALLLLLTLLWGTSWPIFPIVLREVSPWNFRAVSLPVAGLLLLALARLQGQSLAVPRRHWRTMVLAVLCYLVVWNIATTYAVLLIPSGQTAVLGYTMPLWVALISVSLFGERLTPRLMLALALGGAGVLMLVARSVGAYAQAPLGFGLGLLAGLGWAVGTLILKRDPIDVPATVLTGWQLLLTSVPLLAGAWWFASGPVVLPSATTVALIVYITLLPMSIGNAAWFAIVRLLPANVAGLSSIMVPVVAMVSGAVVLGEPLGALQVGAMACCAAALALTLLRPA